MKRTHSQIVRTYKAQQLRTTGRKVSLFRFDRKSDWYWLHVAGHENPFPITVGSLESQGEDMKKRPTFVEDTHEEKCKALGHYLKEAEKTNKWANEATQNLLTNIGPRISALGNKMYMGCGFHYSMEKNFAKLISNFALPWQPSMNHYHKCKDEFSCWLVRKVMYEGLIEDVEKAEKSAIELAKRS